MKKEEGNMDKDFYIEICNKKKNLSEYNGSEADVIIPESVEEIGEEAFGWNDILETIVIPQGVKKIGERTFILCESLKIVQLPKSLKTISAYAFYGCSNLSSLVIPKRIKNIEEFAFAKCPNLELKIFYHHASSYIPKIKNYFGFINLLDDTNRQIGKLFIPSELPLIHFLERLISGRIDHLSEYDALFLASNEIIFRKFKAALNRLEYSLELDDKFRQKYIQYLRNNAEIITPRLIKRGDIKTLSRLAEINAFSQKNFMDNIDLANDLSKTEILSFLMKYKNDTWGMKFQISLDLEKEKGDQWDTQENWDGSYSITKYLGNDKNVIIPAKLNGKEISRIKGSMGSLKISIFFPDRNQVQSVIIEDGIKEIGDRAFLECKSLKTIKIPKSVTIIGKEAFGSCSKLEGIMLPSNLLEIKDRAFYGCNSLSTIMIPNSVTKISHNAFECCEKLTIHTSKGSRTADVWETEPNPDGSLTINKYLCKKTHVTIPALIKGKQVSRIKNGPGWAPLVGVRAKSVIIENGIREIGIGSFEYCTHLKSVLIPSSVTIIGEIAFWHCNKLEEIILPNKLYEIKEAAFMDCTNIIKIVIPESVKRISNDAFKNCDNLVIHTPKNSYAFEFAQKQKFPFELI